MNPYVKEEDIYLPHKISAREASVISYININKLDDIYIKIREAASSGYFSITYQIDIPKNVKDVIKRKLEKDGYKVSVVKSRIEISW